MARKSYKQRVLERVTELGAKVEINTASPLDLNVDAPVGYKWTSVGVHSVVGSQWDGESEASVWRSLLKDLEGGLEKCDTPDCDSCSGADNETERIQHSCSERILGLQP